MALVDFDKLEDEDERTKIAQLTAAYSNKEDYFRGKAGHGGGYHSCRLSPA